MSYARIDDMVARFGEREIAQLTNRDGLDVVDADVLDEALADANAEVQGYLATRYRVPPDPVPRLLVRVACDVARYRLYDDGATDEVRRRYEDAVRLLKSVADGGVSLGEDAAAPSHPQLAQVVDVAPGLFSRRPNGGLR